MRSDRRHVFGPAWVPTAVLVAGLAVVVVGDRALVGGVIMGVAFALAAGLRLVLPEDRAGGLVVRTRGFDLVALVALAVAVTTAFALVDWAGSP